MTETDVAIINGLPYTIEFPDHVLEEMRKLTGDNPQLLARLKKRMIDEVIQAREGH